VPGDCTDGIFCNGAEACVGDICVPPLADPCDDGVACTADSCNEQMATCGHVGNDALCDDADVCNGAETCEATGCAAGTPVPPPTEVAGLSITGDSPTTLSWTGQGPGVRYDVALGDLSDLPQDLGVVGASCLVDDETGSSSLDPSGDPAEGSGYYYIIRAQDSCGSGTYGFSSAGQERLPAAACP
jgi:hypothetical protein